MMMMSFFDDHYGRNSRCLIDVAVLLLLVLLVVPLLLLLPTVVISTTTTTRQQLPQLVDVFQAGVSKYSWSYDHTVCYRIPSLIITNLGTLLAVASERIAPSTGADWGWCNDHSITNLVSRRSHDNGRTWEDAAVVVKSGSGKVKGGFNGWLINDDNTGRIFLFYNTAMTSLQTTNNTCDCRVSYIYSDDDGIAWSNTNDIPPRRGSSYPFLGSGLTSGITIRKSGRLIGCMRKICDNSCPQPYHSKAFYSDGTNWQMSHNLPNGTTECQIAELSNGNLYMSIRPYTGWNISKDVRLKSLSYNDGTTWTWPKPEPQLVDYGFADEGSIVSDPNSGVMYFVHPYAHDRSNLTIYQSNDDGRTWNTHKQQVVYAGMSAYSSATILDPQRLGGGRGRNVGVLFERDGYGRLSYARVSYDDDDDNDDEGDHMDEDDDDVGKNEQQSDNIQATE